MSHKDLPQHEPTSWTWAPWVLGWQWIVGGVCFVVPAYFLAGREVAVWVGLGVLLASSLVSWLSLEASRALQLDRKADARTLDTSTGRQRSPTFH